jgi:hypothetical protein
VRAEVLIVTDRRQEAAMIPWSFAENGELTIDPYRSVDDYHFAQEVTDWFFEEEPRQARSRPEHLYWSEVVFFLTSKRSCCIQSFVKARVGDWLVNKLYSATDSILYPMERKAGRTRASVLYACRSFDNQVQSLHFPC